MSKKRCNGCAALLPLSSFTVRTKKNEVCSRCKACRSAENNARNKASPKTAVNRRAYYEANRDTEKLRARDRNRQQLADPVFYYAHSLRGLLRFYVSYTLDKSKSKMRGICGLEPKELKAWLIKTALDRYGVWADFMDYQIDHVVPLRTAKCKEDVERLNHYSNLQLLTPYDNHKKGNTSDRQCG